MAAGDPQDQSPQSKPILVVIVVGAIILFATVATFMGWLPLTPKNDLFRSLQR
jgi:hypothetical protein